MYKILESIDVKKLEVLAERSKSDYWSRALAVVKLAMENRITKNQQKWLKKIAKEHNFEYFKKIEYDKFLK